MSERALIASKGSETPIGLVGCGRMGRPMLGHILAAGFEAVVHDRVVDAAAGLPATRTAATPRDVADACTIVLGCVPTIDAFDEIVAGKSGLIGGRRMRLYVHLGTTGLAHARQLAATLAAAGIHFLDAPMSGGVARAVSGTLASMVSGPSAAIDAARPLLQCYSASIVEFGDQPGAAQAAKLINNMLSAANLALAIEGILAGVKAGIAPPTLMRLLTQGTGTSNALETKVANHVITRTFDFSSSLEVISKDMTAWRAMADELELVCPLSQHVHQTYMAAIAELSSGADMTAVAKYLEGLEGVTIPASPRA